MDTVEYNQFQQDHKKDRVILSYDNERLFELFEQWREHTNPHDKICLGVVSFLQYIMN